MKDISRFLGTRFEAPLESDHMLNVVTAAEIGVGGNWLPVVFAAEIGIVSGTGVVLATDIGVGGGWMRVVTPEIGNGIGSGWVHDL